MAERADPDELTLAQVMLPEDANPRGNVHGGTLMKLADTAGGVCASRHTRNRVVTVVMDSMTFEQPVYVGNLVIVHAHVTWTGRTSIETEVSIDAEDVLSGDVRHISTAYLVFVAIDENGHRRRRGNARLISTAIATTGDASYFESTARRGIAHPGCLRRDGVGVSAGARQKGRRASHCRESARPAGLARVHHAHRRSQLRAWRGHRMPA